MGTAAHEEARGRRDPPARAEDPEPDRHVQPGQRHGADGSLAPELFLHFLTVAEQSKRSALLRGRLSGLKKTIDEWEAKRYCTMQQKRQIYYAAYKVAKQV